MAHPILAPSSHCVMILDSQDLYAAAQVGWSLKARRYGPDDGSSEGPAAMGPRSKGMGRSNFMVVEETVYSSRFWGKEGSM